MFHFFKDLERGAPYWKSLAVAMFFLCNASLSVAAAPTISTEINDIRLRLNQSAVTRSIGVTDADEDVLSYAITTSSNGTIVTLSNDGDVLTVTPVANSFGLTTVNIVVSDPGEESVLVTLNINVFDYNLITVSENTLGVNEDEILSVDIDAVSRSGYDLSYFVTTSPSYGTVTGTAPNYVYTPTDNFTGVDSFVVAVDTPKDLMTNTEVLSLDPVGNDYKSVYVTDNIVVLTMYNTDANSAGVILYDHSDPENLVELSRKNLSYVHEAELRGDYLFVLRKQDEGVVTVYDLSDLHTFGEELSSVNITRGEDAMTWSFDGDYLYVGGDSNIYVSVIDISDPSDMTVELDSQAMSGAGHQKLIAHDGYLYLGGNNSNDDGAIRYPITGSPPINFGTAEEWGGGTIYGNTMDMVIDGDYLYFIDHNYGLYVLDLTAEDFSDSKVAGPKDGGANHYDMFKYKHFVFVSEYSTSSTYKTRMYDVSDPTSPTLKEDLFLDYGADDLYAANGYLYFVADDNGLSVYEIADRTYSEVNITVNSVEDFPAISAYFEDIEVNEDADSITLNLQSYLTDDDDGYGDTLTYTVTYNETLISVDQTDELITINFLQDQNGTDNITVTLEDADGDSISDAFFVTVNAVNDDPIIADEMLDITRNMNDADVTYNLNEVFTDVDNSFTFIVSQNSNSNLIAASISESDILSLSLGSNMIGTSHLVITAHAGGVTINNAFKIVVGSNDNWPPVVDNELSNVTMNEESITTVSMVGVYSDEDGDTLTYTASVVSNSDFLTVEVDESVLTLNGVLDENGTATVEIYADDGTIVTTETITVTIEPVNDAPTFTTGSSLSITENRLAIATIVGNDVDGDTLTYNIVSSTDSDLFGIDASTGELTVNTVLNYEIPTDADENGVYVLELSVEDAEYVVTKSFEITVVDENDGPLVTTMLQDIRRRLNQAVATYSIGVTDEDGDSLSYAITTSSNGSIVTLANDGDVLSVSTVADAYGLTTVNIVVSDPDEESVLVTLNINVFDYNLITVSDKTLDVDEDGALSVDIDDGVSRSDYDLSYLVITSPSYGTVSGTAPNYVYTPTDNFTGVDSFVVAVDTPKNLLTNTAVVSLDPVGNDYKSVYVTDNILVMTMYNTNASTAGVILYDHSDPENLVELSRKNLSYVQEAELRGDYLYVLRRNDSKVVTVYDLSDPHTFGSELSSVGITRGEDATTWSFDGDYLYVGGDGNIYVSVIDISDPTNMSVELNSQAMSNGYHQKLLAHDGYLYLAGNTTTDDGVVRYPITGSPPINFGTAEAYGDSDTIYTTWDLLIDGDYLYFVDQVYGMIVLDLTAEDFSDSKVSGPKDGGSNHYDLFKYKHFIFVSEHSTSSSGYKTRMYDVSDPTNPALKEDLFLDYGVDDLYAHDGYLYYLGDNTGVSIYEISDRATAAVSITVNAVEDLPTISAYFEDMEVNEDADSITLNLQSYLTDGDDGYGDTLTYTVTYNETLISVDQTDELITINFLQDQNGTDNITVTLEDADGDSISDAFFVTVNAVNDDPIIADAMLDITRNMNDADVTYNLNEVFTDVDNSFTFIVSQNSNSNLIAASISESDILSLSLGSNMIGTSHLVITAHAGGVTINNAFKIVVGSNDNWPPVVDNELSNVTMNEEAITTVSMVGVYSDEDGDTLTYTASVVSNSDFLTVEVDESVLTLNGVLDENGTATVEIYADDGTIVTTETITVTIEPVNDAPTFTTGSSLSITENRLAIATIVGNDVDGDTLTYNIVSSTDSDLFGIDVSTGELTVNTVLNYEVPTDADENGVYVLELSVEDAEYVVTKSFEITVVDENDTPEATAVLQDIRRRLNQAVATYSIGVTDEDGDSLSYAITTSSNGSIVTLANDGDVLSVSTVADSYGLTTVNIVVSDPDSESVLVTLNINVFDYNLITVSDKSVDVTEEGTVSVDIDDGVSRSGYDLSYLVITSPSYGTVSGTAPNYVYTPTDNFTGVDSFVVAVDTPKNLLTNTAVVSLDPVGNDYKSVYVTDNILVMTMYNTNASTAGVILYDHSDPENLVELSRKNLSYVQEAELRGNYLYVLRRQDSKVVTVYDLSDPHTFGSELSSVGITRGEDATTWSFDGDYLYVGGDGNIYVSVIDISDPTNMSVELNSQAMSNGYHQKLLAHDGYLYLAGNTTTDDGVVRYPITGSPPINFGTAESYGDSNTDYTTWDLLIDGDYLYFVDQVYGMIVLDLTAEDFSDSKVSGPKDGGSNHYDLFKYKHFIFVSEHSTSSSGYKTRMYDVSDPTNPALKEDLFLDYGVDDLYAHDGYLYYLGDNTGVSIYEISDRATAAVSITVNAVEDLPTISAYFEDMEVNEDADSITLNLKSYLTDGDDGYGDTLTYTVTYNETLISVDQTDELITINFLQDQNGVTAVTVNLEDADGDSISDAFLVTVNPVNDDPIIADAMLDITRNMNDADVTYNLNEVFTDVDNSFTFIVSQNSNSNLIAASISESDILSLSLGSNMIGTSHLVITAHSGGVTINNAFKIVVGSNDNWPPVVDNELSNVTMNEEAITTVSMVGVYSDEDGDTLTYTASVVSNSDFLTVEVDESVLTLNGVLDENGAATVEIYADDGTIVTTETITVTIEPVNDAPTFTTGSSLSITENRLAIATIVGNDVDGDTLTYNIVSSTDSDLFSIDASTGALTVETALNYEVPTDNDSNGVYVVELSVEDAEYVVTKSFEITVVDENDGPVVTTMLQDIRRRLNQAVATYSIGVTDEDGDSLSYAITTSSNGSIVTLTNDGDVLSVASVADAYGLTTVNIVVSDPDSESVLVTLNINVFDYNLITVSDKTLDVDEEGTLSVDIDDAVSRSGYDLSYFVTTSPSYGTVTGTAPNYVYTPTENFTGVDSFVVAVDTPKNLLTNTAVVSLDPVGNDYKSVYVTDNILVMTMYNTNASTAGVILYDHSDPENLVELSRKNLSYVHEAELRGDYLFVLRRHDTKSVTVYDLSDLHTFGEELSAINLTQGQDASSWSFSGDYLYVGGNNDDYVSVIDISDPSNMSRELNGQSLNMNHYKLMVHDGYLYLGGNTSNDYGVVRYPITGSPPVNFGTAEIYEDGDTFGYTHDMLVDGDYLYFIDQNDGLIVLDLTAEDFSDSKVAGPKDGGSNHYDLFKYKHFIFVSEYSTSSSGYKTRMYDVSDPTSPTLKEDLFLDYGADDLYAADGYLYYLGDDTGVSVYEIPDRTYAEVTITVNAVSDLPTVSAEIADITVNEDASVTTFNLLSHFDDPDLIYGGSFSYSVTYNETLLSIDQSGDMMTINYLEDQNGTSNVVVTAEDESENGVSLSFMVTVNAVDDSPVIVTAFEDITRNINEADATFTLSDVFSDVDSDLNFSVSSNTNVGLLSATISESEELVLSFASDTIGTAYITVAAEGDGVTINDTFRVVVGGDNWPPVVDNEIADLSMFEDVLATASMIDVFSDEDNDPLTYTASVVSNSDILTVSVDGTHLTLNAVENLYGTAVVEVYANDGEIVTTETVTVTIEPVNDAPGFTTAAALNATENVLSLATIVGSDIENDTLTYNIVSSEDSDLFTIDASTGALTVATVLDYENPTDDDANGVYVVEISVEDAEYTVTRSFEITVTDDNDAPSVNVVLADLTARMNGRTITKSIGVVDVDSGDSLTYSLSATPASIVSLSNSGDVLSITLLENAYGETVVSINVSDSSQESVEVTFNMTVLTYNTVTVSDQSLEVDEEAALNVDIDDALSWMGYDLAYSVTVSPSYGTVTGTAPNYVYTPTDNFTGVDTFTVAVDTPIITIDEDTSGDDPLIGPLSLNGAETVYVSNNIVYFGSDDNGDSVIEIYDHTDPSQLTHLNTITSNVDFREIMVMDHYLLVLRASSTETIRVYDISDLSNIGAPVSTIDLPNGSNSSHWILYGDYLYAGGEYEINIVNVSNLESLSAAASNISMPRHFKYIIEDGFLYVALDDDGDTSGFARYELTDPLDFVSTEEIISHTKMNDDVFALAKEGDYLYVLDQTDGLVVVDVSSETLENSDVVRTSGDDSALDNGSNFREIFIYNQYLYTQQGTGEIRIYDISNPAIPTYKDVMDLSQGSTSAYKHADDLYITDGYLYFVDRSRGLSVMEVSERALAEITVTVGYSEDDPELSQSFSDIEVYEDSAVTTLNLSEYFTDPDLDYGDSLSYSVTYNNELLLNIELSGSILTINYLEQQSGTDNVTVTAEDEAGNTVSDAFFVTVNSVGDIPEITSTDNVGVYGIGSAYIAVAVDSDSGDTLTYSLSGGVDDALFTIDSATGTVNFVSTPDYNDPSDANTDNDYEIVVSVTDEVSVVTQAVTITILENTLPVFSSSDSVTITENIQTVVTVSATDSDSHTVTFSILADNDGALFEIDEDSGVLSFLTVANYESPHDGNTDNTYSIVIEASDTLDISTQSLTIAVLDINETMTLSSEIASFSVDEDAEATTINMRSYFSDPDDNISTYSVTVSSDPSDLLIITEDDATLTINYAEDLSGTATVYIAATDGEFTVTESFGITVNTVNDGPVVIDPGFVDKIVSEDASEVTVNLESIFEDVDSVLSFEVTANTNDSVVTTSIDSGTITFGFPTNAFGQAVITVEATADGQSVTDSILITVNAVNDIPTITSTGTITVSENETTVITLVGSDVDEDTLVYTVVTSTDSSLFSVDSSSGALSFTTAANYEDPSDANDDNQYEFVVQVSDGTVNVTQSITVTVVEENDAPVISGSPDDDVNEDEAYSFEPTASDEDNDDMTFLILNQPSWASFDSNTGELTGTPNNEDTGVYAGIEIAVSDGVLITSLNSFSITVNGVDDAPVVIDPGFEDLVVNEDADSVTVNLASIFEDVDSDLSYVVTSNSSGLVVTTSIGNSVLTLNFIEDAFGTAVIEVEAFADGKSVTDSFIVTVNAINDAPLISGSPDDEVTEDNAYSFVPTSSDVDDNSLVFSILNKPSWASFDTGTGALTGTPGNETIGYYSGIEIGVSDDDVTVSLNVFSITVNAEDDAPVVIDPGFEDLIVSEDATAVTINLLSIFEDVDSDLSFVVTSNTNGAVVTTSIGESILTLNFVENAFGVAVIEVDASADGQSVTDSFIVTVNSVNDDPVISGSPDDAVDEDVAYNFIPTASDVDDNSLVFSILNKPSWADFNTGTGELSGTPDNSDTGYYSQIEIGVSDDDVTVSLNVFGITVNAIDDGPTIIDPGFEDLIVNEDADPVTINVSSIFEDIDSNDLSFVVTSNSNESVVETSLDSTVLTLNFVSDANGVATIEVEARADGQTISDSFIVTVNAVDDAPVVIDSGFEDRRVSEDETAIAIDLTTIFEDVDSDLSYVVTGNSAGLVVTTSIDAAVMTLNFVEDANGDAVIEVEARGDGQFVTDIVVVTVEAVDDAPRVIGSGLTDKTVLEGASDYVKDLSTIFEDVDSNTLVFTIESETDTDVVRSTISGDQFTAEFLEDQFGSSNIVIKATADGQSVTDSLTLTVSNVNDLPEIESADTVSVSENTTAVITVIGTDLESDTVTYSITGGVDSASFELDGSTGELIFVEAPNYEADSTEYEVEVGVGDGSATVTQSITVTVVDVNESPELALELLTLSVLEDATPSTVNMSQFFTDPEDNISTYEVTAIVGAALVELATENAVLTVNYVEDENGSVELEIRASDGEYFATASVTITINAVNDAPVISGTADDAVDEDTAYSFVPTATDVDDSDLSFAIENRPSWADFDTETGELSGTPGNDDVGRYTAIVIGVSDGELSVSLNVFTITVNATDDGPVVVDPGFEYIVVTEDASAVTVNLNTIFEDQDSDLTYVLTTNTNGSIVTTSIEESVLTLDFIADAFGVAVIEVEATGDNQSVTDSFVVTVNAVNDAPVISGVPDDAVTEDTAYSFVPTATDVDDSDLSFAIENRPSWADFDAETGELSGTPGNDDAGGYSTIIIGVSDGELSVSLNAFSITVNAEDDSPTVIDPGFEDLTVSEDSTVITVNLSTIFEDQDSDLSYLVVGNTNGSVVTTSIGESVLRLTFIENAFGVAVIEVEAMGDNQSVTDSFVVTVNAVNDAPVISGTPDDEVNEDAVYSFEPTVSDVDDTEHVFTIVNKPSWATFDSNTGELTGTPGNDDVSSYTSIEIAVSDDDVTVSLNSFSITVNATDDGPVIIDPGFEDIVVTEDAEAVTINLLSIFEDPDSELSFALSRNSNDLVVTTSILDSVLTLDFLENAFGVLVIEVEAEGDGVTVTDSFIVTVNPVNDLPVFTSTGTITVSENIVTSDALFVVVGEDVDQNDLVYSIAEGLDSEHFSIDEQTGELFFNLIPDYESAVDTDVNNNYLLVVAVDDGGELTTQLLSVTVIDINEVPVLSGSPDTEIDEGESYSFLPTASDPEDVDLSFSIENQPDWLDFDSSTGELSGSPRGSDQGLYSGIVISVTDGLHFVSMNAFSITVNGVDDPTELIGSGIEDMVVSEDADLVTVDLSSIFSDEDSDLTYLVSSNSHSSVVSASILDEELRLEFLKDMFGVAVLNIEALGDADPVLDSFVVTVNAVDDAPVLIGDGFDELIVSEDSQLVTVNLFTVFDDVDSELSFLLTDSTDETVVSASVDADILSIEFLENAFGSTSLTIRAVGDQQFVSDSVALTVNAVNDLPVISGLAERIATEDSEYVFSPTATDVDGDALVFTGENLPSWVSFSTENGRLTGTPGQLDVGDYEDILISVSDGFSEVSLATFSMSVVEVNEAPTVSGNPDEAVDQDQRYRFIPESSDEEGDVLTFSIENKPSWLSFDESTGELVGTPNNEDVGVYADILLSVSDAEFVVSLNSFTITVNQVDDGPVLLGDGFEDISVEEDADPVTVNLATVFSDPDGDAMTLAVSGNTNSDLLSAEIENSVLTLTFTENHSGSATIIVSAMAKEKVVTDSFVVTVSEENDAPVFVSTPNATVTSNQRSVSGDIVVSDADEDSIVFTIEGGADQALFDIDSDTGVLSTSVTLNYLSYLDSNLDGRYELSIGASDGSALVTTAIVVRVVADDSQSESVLIEEDSVLSDYVEIVDTELVVNQEVSLTFEEGVGVVSSSITLVSAEMHSEGITINNTDVSLELGSTLSSNTLILETELRVEQDEDSLITAVDVIGDYLLVVDGGTAAFGTIEGDVLITGNATLMESDSVTDIEIEGSLTLENSTLYVGLRSLVTVGDVMNINNSHLIVTFSVSVSSEISSSLGYVAKYSKLFSSPSSSDSNSLEEGDSFTILSVESIEGTFATVSLPELGESLEWDLSNLYKTGVVAVVSSIVEESPWANHFLAYPNPMSLLDGNSVDIGFNVEVDGYVTVFVYNMLGHLMVQKVAYVSPDEYNRVTLHESDFVGAELSAGVYFFVVQSGDEILGRGKFGVTP